MKNSNIDVDIIDETLLYVCIDGKREHISVDNARIKYSNNNIVLDSIDKLLAKYHENSRPLEHPSEHMVDAVNIETTPNPDSLEALNSVPLASPKKIVKDDSETINAPDSKISLKDLDHTPLTGRAKLLTSEVNQGSPNAQSLKDLNNAPLVDESKFAKIYYKHKAGIREIFPTDSPSFLDVEKLTRNSKPLKHEK